MITRTLNSLASTRQLFLQLPQNVCTHAGCSQAIQILFRWSNHHIVQLGSLVVEPPVQSTVKEGTRCLSERISTIRPVQYEAPGANRYSPNSCHLYSRPTKRTLYSHSLLRFLQVFSHLVLSCFMPAPSAHGISRTTPFSSKRSSAASVLITCRSGPTLQWSSSNICPWRCSSDQ